jgi:hypothetical protein
MLALKERTKYIPDRSVGPDDPDESSFAEHKSWALE